MQFSSIEFMVNGGEFGGQAINVVVSYFARQVVSAHLEAIMPAGVIAPGIWQKVFI